MKKGPTPRAHPTERDSKILARIKAGEGYAAIADDYAITRQRVEQIYSRWDPDRPRIPSKQGGYAALGEEKATELLRRLSGSPTDEECWLRAPIARCGFGRPRLTYARIHGSVPPKAHVRNRPTCKPGCRNPAHLYVLDVKDPALILMRHTQPVPGEECLLWVGSTGGPMGRGGERTTPRMGGTIDGKRVCLSVRVLLWDALNPDQPRGRLKVGTTCNTRFCVAPAHLALGVGTAGMRRPRVRTKKVA